MEMNTQLKSHLNTYLALVFLTLCSLLLAESGWFIASLSRQMTEVIILMVVGMKIFLVAFNFMELRFSPKWLLSLMGTWIITIVALLSGFVVFFSELNS